MSTPAGEAVPQQAVPEQAVPAQAVPEQQEPVLAQNDASVGEKVDGILAQTRVDVGSESVDRIAEVLRQRFHDSGISLPDDRIGELAQRVISGD